MAFRNRLPCYVCNALRAPVQMTRIGGEYDAHKREIAIFRREQMNHPFLEINNDSRICQPCNINILNEIRILEENLSNIRFNVLRRASGRSCCLYNNGIMWIIFIYYPYNVE